MIDDNKTNIISQYESDKCDRQFHRYKPSKKEDESQATNWKPLQT